MGTLHKDQCAFMIIFDIHRTVHHDIFL